MRITANEIAGASAVAAAASAVYAGLSLRSAKRSEKLAARSARAAERSAATSDAALAIDTAEHHTERRPRLTGRIDSPHRNECTLLITLDSADAPLTGVTLAIRPDQHFWFYDGSKGNIDDGALSLAAHRDEYVHPGQPVGFGLFWDGYQCGADPIDAICHRGDESWDIVITAGVIEENETIDGEFYPSRRRLARQPASADGDLLPAAQCARLNVRLAVGAA